MNAGKPKEEKAEEDDFEYIAEPGMLAYFNSCSLTSSILLVYLDHMYLYVCVSLLSINMYWLTVSPCSKADQS